MADSITNRAEECYEQCEPHADTEIDRQFPRNDFQGSALATIYPPTGEPGEPVSCTVLTRDLSNRGFGIAHSSPLRPQQRVEIDAPQGRLAGEVQWCRQIRAEFYIIGCRLSPS